MRETWKLTELVIGACMEVHSALGPGLLESTYESCLCHELRLHGLSFERQLEVPIHYKGAMLDARYRLDLLVEGALVVEVKALDAILPIHVAQTLTYLRLLNCPVGLVVDFNTVHLRDGLRRLRRHRPQKPPVPPVLPVNSLSGADDVEP
jgi:GxxExxY protein